MRSEEMTYQVMKFVGQKGFRRLMRPVAEVLRPAVVLMVAVLTALALSSCGSGSGDEPGTPGPVTPTPTPSPSKPTPEQPESNDPIVFSAGQQENQDVTRAALGSQGATRAVGLEEKAQSFKVWGYKNMSVSEDNYSGLQTVIPGYRVNWRANSAHSSATNTNDWEYLDQQQGQEAQQTIKYWDWSAKAYRFFGVTGEGGVTVESGQATFTIDDADASSAEKINAMPYYSKLWFSTGNQVTYPDKQFGRPVQLEFVKPYARVRFIFNYITPREGVILADPQFRPTDEYKRIIRKGAITVSYPLTGTETLETITMASNNSDPENLEAFTEDYDPDNTSKVYSLTDHGWYTVLPNPTQGSYTLHVNVNGNDKSATVPEQYMHWLPGYSYTYIFKVNADGGVEIGGVEYAVTPWVQIEGPWTAYNW